MSKARELSQRAGVDGALSNRNLIINGAMQVAQRTTGPVSVAPYQYNTADRMRFSFSGANAGSWTQEVVSGQDVGDYIGNALKNTCTAAGNVGITAGNNIRLEKTNLEKFVGKTLTLSFYAKADAPLTMTPQVFGDTIVDLDQLTFTTSYQRYVSTFVVPAMTTKSFFDLSMRVDASVATTHYITGVQLEYGDTATPFEHRSYGQELALCQRYFRRRIFENDMLNAAITGNLGMVPLGYGPTLRAKPTISTSTTIYTRYTDTGSDASTATARSFSYYPASVDNNFVYTGLGYSMTYNTYHSGLLTSGAIDLDAEL